MSKYFKVRYLYASPMLSVTINKLLPIPRLNETMLVSLRYNNIEQLNLVLQSYSTNTNLATTFCS